MKMVAASRLRRVQNDIVHLRSYSHLLKHILDQVMDYLPPSKQNVYMRKKTAHDVLVICIGSNKGLCGTYNAFLYKYCKNQINRLQKQGSKVQLMVIGKKPERVFLKNKDTEIIPGPHHLIEKPTYEAAADLSRQAMDLFLTKNFGRVIVVYNRFKNAVVHELTAEQVLPLAIDEMLLKKKAESVVLPNERLILEPDHEQVVDYMCRQYIQYNFYRILLDASASEHGSRMTAMHKATDNAEEMLKNLTLSYNKARQAAVTRELLDIVGGAERITH